MSEAADEFEHETERLLVVVEYELHRAGCVFGDNKDIVDCQLHEVLTAVRKALEIRQ